MRKIVMQATNLLLVVWSLFRANLEDFVLDDDFFIDVFGETFRQQKFSTDVTMLGLQLDFLVVVVDAVVKLG